MVNLDSEEFILHLQQSLRFMQVNRLRTAITVRCPYCGDSQKTLNKGHLNIKIDDPRCFLWRCVRCGVGGIVNLKFIKDLDCYDPELLDIGMRNNLNAKEYFKGRKSQFKVDLFSKKNMILNYNDSSLSKEKLEYVCDRLNQNITFKLAKRFKIITDFYQFLEDNRLNITESEKLIETLQNDGVGFLSWDNSMIVFRNIHGEFFGDKRYYNYSIFGKNNLFSNKFYSLNKPIDIMSSEFKVNMTEGIFDILGLAFSELKDEIKEKNSIMVACNGQSYANILNVLKELGFINLEVRFFSDSDVNKKKFEKIKNQLLILKHNQTRLFYNTLGKDYGVPSEKIKIKEAVL